MKNRVREDESVAVYVYGIGLKVAVKFPYVGLGLFPMYKDCVKACSFAKFLKAGQGSEGTTLRVV